ncbi:MAG: YajQ family cyclic di-GMP-binding protein [Bacteroidia bacterium]
MPSFDIVSKVDPQTLDNAINSAKKEIQTRYDFRGSNTTIELDKKTNTVHVVTEHEMKIDAIEDIIMSRMIKQGLDPKSLDFGKEKYASGNMIKKDIKIKEGIDKEAARKIVKAIKDLKIKVEPAVMDEQVRVTGKKIDDLQAAMQVVRQGDFGVAVQFVNIK